MIRGRRQARHDTDVDRVVACAEDAQAYAPNLEFSMLRRGGRSYDPDINLDRSPNLDPLGPCAFTRVIRRAHLPQRFRPPENVLKYTGETNPGMWLEDYQLACRAGGVNNDLFVIQYLPICLGDNVRAWLKFLPADSNGSWADLRKLFVGNF